MDTFEQAFNHLTGAWSPIEAAVEYRQGRWYIKMGYAGFNSVANNNMGYAYEQSAIRAVRRYQEGNA